MAKAVAAPSASTAPGRVHRLGLVLYRTLDGEWQIWLGTDPSPWRDGYCCGVGATREVATMNARAALGDALARLTGDHIHEAAR